MKYRLPLMGLAFAVAVFAADQMHKWFMLEIVHIQDRPPIEVTALFNLVMTWNTGISFGLFAEHNQPLILIAVSTGIVAILLGWLVKSDSKWVAASLGVTIGGALGNVADRLRFGAVADFFDFHIGGWHWPAFNIADAAIFIGVVLLCAHSMVVGHRPNHKEPV